MDIPDYANAIETALLAFHANVEDGDDDNLLRYTRYTSCFIVEMTKRWAERKYVAKRIGREVTIEETVERSMEETERIFRRLERKNAPARLAHSISESEELFAFLDQEPKPKHDPGDKDDGAGDQEKPDEAPEQVPEPPEEPPEPMAAHEPSATTFGGAAAEPEGPEEHYTTISPEEFAKIPPR